MLLAIAFPSVVCLATFARSFRVGASLAGIGAAALVTWYVQDRPSNDRPWASEYAVLATSEQRGQIVEIKRVRNFSHRSETDFTPAYYDATFPLDGLATVDLVTSHWAGEAIAHVFLTFGFRDGRHLAVSIETRRQEGDIYSTVAGFFHHYELAYVVADERDLIGVRTDVRREQVYLYRLNTTARQREALFLSYTDKLNQLAQRPEWYNTLTDNCTTGILFRSAAIADIPYNWRLLLSGYAASYAYSLGMLDSSKPFADLRALSLIKRPAASRVDSTYSQEIRRDLPLADARVDR